MRGQQTTIVVCDNRTYIDNENFVGSFRYRLHTISRIGFSLTIRVVTSLFKCALMTRECVSIHFENDSRLRFVWKFVFFFLFIIKPQLCIVVFDIL